MSENTGVTSLASGEIVYFYYAGTAPTYPTLEFTLTPIFSDYYITSPCNSYASTISKNGTLVPYNTITIESIGK